MGIINLKISINGIKPLIWRKIKISSKATLLDLHYVIQHAFGWTNSHLFIFQVGMMEFVNTPDWEEDADKFQSAELAILDDLIPKRIPVEETFSYIYDLGDYWQHEILVESIDDSNQSFRGAICLAGDRACPPEDVGSVPGYDQLLEDLKDVTPQRLQQIENWLGYHYDPEAFDLNEVNLFIRDYFKTTLLNDDTYWSKSLPLYNPRFDFTSSWLNQLEPQYKDYAERLPFRRDVVSLLTYLRDYKVRGTKAMGNFPRKDIRALASLFENPMRLDLDFGDRVYELRSEDEVPEMIFIHNFVNAAGLILGGENLLWETTRLGEIFLEKAPEEQAWFLTKFWYYQFNWQFCYPFSDAEINGDIFSFQPVLNKLLTAYPTDGLIEIKQVINDLDQNRPGWVNTYNDSLYAENTKFRFFLDVIVKPFEKFGLCEVVKIKDDDFDFDFYFHYTHMIMTNYGKTLMLYLQ